VVADGSSCSGSPGKCCSGACDANGTDLGGTAVDCRAGPSCVAGGNWSYSTANDGVVCASNSSGYCYFNGTTDYRCTEHKCDEGYCRIETNVGGCVECGKGDCCKGASSACVVEQPAVDSCEPFVTPTPTPRPSPTPTVEPPKYPCNPYTDADCCLSGNNCWIDGVCYADGTIRGTSPDQTCAWCDVSKTKTAWSARPASTVCSFNQSCPSGGSLLEGCNNYCDGVPVPGIASRSVPRFVPAAGSPAPP